jgi:hypothetical protein
MCKLNHVCKYRSDIKKLQETVNEDIELNPEIFTLEVKCKYCELKDNTKELFR